MAAAIADPLVEGASNAGFFGQGNYTDRSSLDVIPALAVGLALALILIAVRVRHLLRRRRVCANWLRASADALDEKSIRRLIPVVLLLQLLALFFMESVEQLVVYGHVLGGAIWLGGPLFASVAVHAIAGIALAAALPKIVREFADTLAELISLVLAFIMLRPARGPSVPLTPSEFFVSRNACAAFRAIAERAPPLCA